MFSVEVTKFVNLTKMRQLSAIESLPHSENNKSSGIKKS